MDRAAESGVFPGGVLLVARGPEPVGLFTAGLTEYGPLGRPVALGTIYDLASLTKILSTTILFMIFTDRGLIRPETLLADLFPGEVTGDKAGLTMAHLLGHASGWPAWRPYYEVWSGLPEADRRPAALATILREPLEYPPGQKAVYSDLNFILLGLLLEQVGESRQDVLFDREVAGRLGLVRTGYRPLDGTRLPESGRTGGVIAATEDVPRRGGVIRGQVHDDNAAALARSSRPRRPVRHRGGGLGHFKGLLRRAYRDEPGERLVSTETRSISFWRAFANWPRIQPGLWGLDTPSAEVNSSAGRLFLKAECRALGIHRDVTVVRSGGGPDGHPAHQPGAPHGGEHRHQAVPAAQVHDLVVNVFRRLIRAGAPTMAGRLIRALGNYWAI